ncbi:MAG: histidine phosphatase family protein [Lentisphaeraceae bacterium]|nr:histidine phosphatase family protein [Lentisphaeraceae bacterium]
MHEAEKCGHFLKDFPFQELYTSDYLRAQQTMGILDLSLEKEVSVSKKLREVEPFYAMGDIELIKEHGEPVKEFFMSLLDGEALNSLILAVTHSHLIRYILSLRSVIDNSLEPRSIKDLKNDSLIDKNSSMVEIENSSITVVDITKSGLLVPRLINYTDHLA